MKIINLFHQFLRLQELGSAQAEIFVAFVSCNGNLILNFFSAPLKFFSDDTFRKKIGIMFKPAVFAVYTSEHSGFSSTLSFFELIFENRQKKSLMLKNLI